jgi:predicted DNA-binding protein with PD1-like motif
MRTREITTTDEYLVRLEHGGDWRAQIEEFAVDNEVEAGWFHGMGAVFDADLLYYDFDDKEYRSHEFDGGLEVSACVGNVSDLDGEPFAHTHVVLGLEDGSTVSGHLDAAEVFAGEVYLRAFEEPLVREFDGTTGLDLWL